MMRQETKTEVKTQTPAGNGGGLEATMRELGEIVERITARLRAMGEREEKEMEEWRGMFARFADEQRRQERMLAGGSDGRCGGRP